jgi:hypothetical protein
MKKSEGCAVMSPSGYSCEVEGEHQIHRAFEGEGQVTWGPPRVMFPEAMEEGRDG